MRDVNIVTSSVLPQFGNSRESNLLHALLFKRTHLSLFVVLTGFFILVTYLYGLNLLDWSKTPDFGWTTSNQQQKVILLTVHGDAKKAGLKVGDQVVGVNGHIAHTVEQLRQYVNRTVGEKNTWKIFRNKESLSFSVPNVALGLIKAFLRSGITWVLGICLFVLGIVVYVMKPGAHPSWAFLIAMFNFGLYVIFTNTASRLSPEWLAHILTFSAAFQTAPILHLAMTFPVEHAWIRKHRSVLISAPYLLSALLFMAMFLSASQFVELSSVWKKLLPIYTLICIGLFIGSLIFTALKTNNLLTRTRSKIIVGGLVIGASPPLMSVLLELFFDFRLYSNNLINLIFYLVIPITVGYSIVRHNLFDVDVYIKRAVGYGIMILVVMASYFLLQTGATTFILNPLFGGDSAQQTYPLVFALFVVFLFNPINTRVRIVVDRVFFREKLDYKQTVLTIGDSLSSVLDIKEIVTRIVDTVRSEMFIDTVGMILLNKQSNQYAPFFISDNETDHIEIRSDNTGDFKNDPLIELLRKEKKLITRYDVNEDNRYGDIKVQCDKRFQEYQATMVFPLLYQEELIGILYLGNKKSGKFYTREDIDLIHTLSIQGAVALENAKLAEQMRKEAEVRSNLARYLSPQIVERVMQEGVELNLGGQRKVVTILFSDIRNFTGISETWPPDQLVTILNEYMTEMVSVIFDHKGSIDKYVGDAIIAVFGSLIDIKNPAENAVRAAIGMQQAMPKLNAKWKNKYGVDMYMGIGVTTGEVFLGNIGSPERMEFTVIGDWVNVASRFSGVAKANEIITNRNTIQQLSKEIQYSEMPKVKVKGKASKMEIFRVMY